MAKVIDITEKLSFDENPIIKVKGQEIEVNADATTVLKIMGILGDGKNVTPNDTVEMCGLIFGEEDAKKIENLRLKFTDFQKLVNEAINLITGGGGQGEQ